MKTNGVYPYELHCFCSLSLAALFAGVSCIDARHKLRKPVVSFLGNNVYFE